MATVVLFAAPAELFAIIALRVRLHRRYGVELPPTILWNKPTVAALAEHLVDRLGDSVS